MVAEAVLLAAEGAIDGGFGIVEAVADGWNGPQVGEDGGQIIVGHVTEIAIGHDGAEIAGASRRTSCADGLNEHGCIVVGNAGWIGGNVGADHGAPRSGHAESAAEHFTGQDVAVFVVGRVAIVALRDAHKVPAVFDLVGSIGRNRRLHFGLKIDFGIIGEFSLRQNVVNRRKRAKVNDDGGNIFIGHAAKECVGHGAAKDSAVVTDAVTNGAFELRIGPGAGSGFFVGSKVRMRKHRFDGNVVERLILRKVAGTFCAGLRLAVRLEIRLTMTAETVGDAGNDVAAAGEAFRRRCGNEFSLPYVLVSCGGIQCAKW